MRNPLPTAEVAIGARLRQFRDSLRLSRPVLAAQLQIPTETLAAYESGRAPFPWRVFVTLAERFFVSPAWLATGKGHPLSPFESVTLRKMSDDPRARFSSVFAEHAPLSFPTRKRSPRPDGRDIVRTAEAFNQQLEILAAADESARQKAILAPRVIDTLGAVYNRTGHALHEAGAALARRAAQRGSSPKSENISPVIIGNPKVKTFPLLPTAVGKDEEKALTPHGTPCDIRGMPQTPQWDELLAEVREKASERGMITKLAELLNLPRQRVSEWLRGVHTPDATTTLQLLRWVRGEKLK